MSTAKTFFPNTFSSLRHLIFPAYDSVTFIHFRHVFIRSESGSNPGFYYGTDITVYWRKWCWEYWIFGMWLLIYLFNLFFLFFLFFCRFCHCSESGSQSQQQHSGIKPITGRAENQVKSVLFTLWALGFIHKRKPFPLNIKQECVIRRSAETRSSREVSTGLPLVNVSLQHRKWKSGAKQTRHERDVQSFLSFSVWAAGRFRKHLYKCSCVYSYIFYSVLVMRTFFSLHQYILHSSLSKSFHLLEVEKKYYLL